MPCGCAGEFVSISSTIPSVSFPVRWSFFKTIETRNPGLISERLLPSISFFNNNSYPHKSSLNKKLNVLNIFTINVLFILVNEFFLLLFSPFNAGKPDMVK